MPPRCDNRLNKCITINNIADISQSTGTYTHNMHTHKYKHVNLNYTPKLPIEVFSSYLQAVQIQGVHLLGLK